MSTLLLLLYPNDPTALLPTLVLCAFFLASRWYFRAVCNTVSEEGSSFQEHDLSCGKGRQLVQKQKSVTIAQPQRPSSSITPRALEAGGYQCMPIQSRPQPSILSSPRPTCYCGQREVGSPSVVPVVKDGDSYYIIPNSIWHCKVERCNSSLVTRSHGDFRKERGATYHMGKQFQNSGAVEAGFVVKEKCDLWFTEKHGLACMYLSSAPAWHGGEN